MYILHKDRVTQLGAQYVGVAASITHFYAVDSKFEIKTPFAYKYRCALFLKTYILGENSFIFKKCRHQNLSESANIKLAFDKILQQGVIAPLILFSLGDRPLRSYC